MSGGYFEYAQYKMENVAMEIDELIKTNKSKELNEFREEIGWNYADDIIGKFQETSKTLRLVVAMVQRIDWLLSCDDSEDSFRERWVEEVEPLRGL